MVTDDAKMEFSRRLNEVCDDKGIPAKYQGRQQEVATLFGVSQKGARKWLEGEAIPAAWRMPKFAEFFDCNIDWLFAGRGPKRSAPSDIMTNAIQSALVHLQAATDVLDKIVPIRTR